MYKKYLPLLVLLFAGHHLYAQDLGATDKIVGVVGSKIVLQSDVELQAANDPSLDDLSAEEARCNIVYTLLAQQILVEQAERDSVIVSEDEVNAQIDQRIRSFIMQFGSKEAVEQASGQTIYQLKETYRNFFRDKLTAERMQQQIMANIKVTPAETKEFFNEIPADSLPLIPATIEMGEIVITPNVDLDVEKMAKEKLEDIRQQIVSGSRDFSSMASIYSMDPSRNNGGLLTVSRLEVDPHFGSAAFRLQPGEISPVVKSKFGYHIIQMVKRMGDEAQLRHILIIPEVTSTEVKKTMDKLDSIRTALMDGKIKSFSEAVGKYSTDEMAKMTGGMVSDPRTGSTSLEIKNLLDPDLVKAAGDLKIGEYSKPMVFRNSRTQAQQCRILYLKSRTEPHQLNLKDDYNIIQQQALAKKQNEYLFNWVKDKSKDYYINIKPEYLDCPEIQNWQLSEKTSKK